MGYGSGRRKATGVGGKAALVRRRGMRTPRCIRPRGGGSLATLAPRSDRARARPSALDSRARCASGASPAAPAPRSRGLGHGREPVLRGLGRAVAATRSGATRAGEAASAGYRDGPHGPGRRQIGTACDHASPRASARCAGRGGERAAARARKRGGAGSVRRRSVGGRPRPVQGSGGEGSWPGGQTPRLLRDRDRVGEPQRRHPLPEPVAAP